VTAQSHAWIAGGILVAALFVFAFVAAPKSCEWGLDAYFVAGIACAVALLALPFVLRAGRSLALCTGVAAALVALGFAAWVAGLFIANVRILCKLF